MSDRLKYLTVVLENDIRHDDAADVVAAISMIKGVLSVKGHVVNPDDFAARERVRQELWKKLCDALG